MDFVILNTATEEERLFHGKQVRLLRESKGWSQQQLADAAGVGRKTIGSMENGTHAAQADKLRAVFQALGVATETERYSDDIESGLALMGKLIAGISRDRRHEAMSRAMATLGEFLPAHPESDSPGGRQ